MEKKFNGSDKDSIAQYGQEKKSLNKQEYYAEQNKVEDGISTKDAVKIKLNSFNLYNKYKNIVLFTVPIVLMMVYLICLNFINVDSDTLEYIYGYQEILNKMSYYIGLLYIYYIKIFNFGFLSSIIGIDLNYMYMKIYNIFNISNELDLQMITVITYYVFHTILTIGILLLFFIVNIIYDRYFYDESLKFKENIKKLNYLYSSLLEQGGKSEKEFNKDQEKLKECKKDLLEQIKKTSKNNYTYFIDFYKKIYNIGLNYQDSPFCNMISGILNKNILALYKEKTTINTREDFFNVGMYGNFSKEQIKVIQSYNFNLWNKKNVTKLEGNFKNDWEKIKTEKLNKETAFKYLCILMFFKNYPVVKFFEYLENKEEIFFSEEERDFIKKFRIIVFADMKNQLLGKNMKIQDFTYNLLFPELEKSKLNEITAIYKKFVNEHMIKLKLMLSKNPSSGKDANEQMMFDDKAMEEIKNLLVIYKKIMLKYFLQIFKIIFKENNIEEHINLEQFVKNNIDRYYSVKKVQNYNEISKLVNGKLSLYNISVFYTILNITLKDMNIYKKFVPIYLQKYIQLDVRKTFLLINKKSDKFKKYKGQ